MPFQLLSTASVTTLLLTICILIMRRLQTSLFPRAEKKPDNSNLMSNSAEPTPTALSKRLASALPDNILLPHHGIAFKESMNSHWAQQESEVRPACIVRPNDVRQVCTAITILKEEYDERARQDGNKDAQGIFAVRGGGHSPVPGAATVRGGVVIDLSLLRQVTPSEDGSSVTVGAGAKWIDVSQALDKKGLAVVGGRNSAVGVGGLTLGGKPPAFFVFPHARPPLRARLGARLKKPR